jgi:hypothetical protein
MYLCTLPFSGYKLATIDASLISSVGFSVTRRFVKKIAQLCKKIGQNVALQNNIFYPRKLLTGKK